MGGYLLEEFGERWSEDRGKATTKIILQKSKLVIELQKNDMPPKSNNI